MKTLIFLFVQILLLTSLAQAKAKVPPHLNPGYTLPHKSINKLNLEWSELEQYTVYSSAADIIYTDDSRLRYLVYPKGSQFRLNQIIPIPQISTIYFELIHQNCTMPSLKLDLFLFENVVLIVEPGCVLGVYVEAKDYYYPSFLLPLKRKF